MKSKEAIDDGQRGRCEGQAAGVEREYEVHIKVGSVMRVLSSGVPSSGGVYGVVSDNDTSGNKRV